jgi:hypothetical protein
MPQNDVSTFLNASTMSTEEGRRRRGSEREREKVGSVADMLCCMRIHNCVGEARPTAWMIRGSFWVLGHGMGVTTA